MEILLKVLLDMILNRIEKLSSLRINHTIVKHCLFRIKIDKKIKVGF